MTKALLCKVLNPLDRVLRGPNGGTGTIIRHRGRAEDGWDWYDMIWDSSPELVHQARRDYIVPHRTLVYAKSGRHRWKKHRLDELPEIALLFLRHNPLP